MLEVHYRPHLIIHKIFRSPDYCPEVGWAKKGVGVGRGCAQRCPRPGKTELEAQKVPKSSSSSPDHAQIGIISEVASLCKDAFFISCQQAFGAEPLSKIWSGYEGYEGYEGLVTSSTFFVREKQGRKGAGRDGMGVEVGRNRR